MAKLKDGCVKPSKGPIMASNGDSAQSATTLVQEVKKVIARVGKSAPDFEAPAFIAGEGFKNITLSDFKGKWIVLCFYPGDFTFV